MIKNPLFKLCALLKNSFNSNNLIILVLLFNILVGTYKCPFKLITGIDCPGCGLTRAFLSVAKMDIVSAFSFHPMWPVVLIVIVYMLFHKQIVKKISVSKTIDTYIYLAMYGLLLITWIIRVLVKNL